MKQVLIAFFSLVLGTAALQAQTQPGTLPNDVPDITTQQAVAFVKAESAHPSRSVLYIKRPNASVDAYHLTALINSGYGSQIFDSIRHLSVIGMAPDSNWIILGGEIFYQDPFKTSSAVFAGIFRLPWPLTAASIANDEPFDFNLDKPRWFLQPARDLGAFHPAGILSPNGTQWYATMRTSSPGSDPMLFYHGSTSGGSVDSAEITADVAGQGGAPQSGWNISNLALDTTNSTMVAAEVDGLESGGNQSERILIMHWHPGDIAPYAYPISGILKNLQPVQDTIDALFGLTVSALQTNTSLRIGLRDINAHDGTIEFYTTSYTNAAKGLTSEQTIPNSILPPGTTFFAGRNSSEYGDDNSVFHPHGNGGDVILTNDGSTALFITRETPDNPNTNPLSPRNIKSAIFSYDFNTQQATMLYNDSNAQELQPIFVPSQDTTPHVPDIQASPTTPLNFGTVDTGSVSAPQTLTITDTSSFDGTILDAATITGDNEFTIVSPKFPDTIMRNSSVQVKLLFTPVLPAALKTATLTVTSAMSVTKSISVTLKGTAGVKSGSGGFVTEDPSLAENLSIEPNPFSSIASVRLTAQDAGALGIVVHDALGRTVYTSPLIHVGTGASETFNFDAKSLSLPNGIYYVTALFGDRQVSRQVVFVR
ncbi:MAG TPA: hypothetical protein VFH95_12335 [Candidatus Kapabacteria bacterium]|nr:hypothetical protein [Candidatus Kapabacteria bacterium]